MAKATGKGWAARKAARKPTRLSVRVPLDADAADQARRLAEQLPEVEAADEAENRLPQARKLAEQIQALEQQVRDSEEEFTFQALGRRQYQLLLNEHRPSAEQEEVAGAKLIYNIETFPKALLAASCVAPPELAGNAEEWAEIHDEWPAGQVALIWQACVDVNTEVAVTPKSQRASEILALNGSEQS